MFVTFLVSLNVFASMIYTELRRLRGRRGSVEEVQKPERLTATDLGRSNTCQMIILTLTTATTTQVYVRRMMLSNVRQLNLRL